MRTRLVVSAIVAGAAVATAVPVMTAPAVSADGPVILEVGQPPENCPFDYTGVHGTAPVAGGYEVCVIFPAHP